LVVLAIFLAGWWLAPVAIRSWTRAGFYEFEAPAWLAYGRLGEIQDYWSLRNHNQLALIEAGRDLARMNAAQTLLLQQADSAREEVQRLEDLLRLPNLAQFHYEIARVIRRDQTAWWQQIVIGKGSADGLQEGQGVVYAGGVVGRIANIFAHTAVVELVSSPGFRVTANLGDDPRAVIFQGAEAPPFRPPVGEVHSVDLSVHTTGSEPLSLVSSSLSGRFPQGLAIGKVYQLETDTDGLRKSGQVVLNPHLSDLHEVAVLVPLTSPTRNPPTPPAR
jgi:rod shape-determining protein MreC